MLILFNKPFGVLSQFSGSKEQLTLSKYIDQKSVYAAGRLDRDSEGLLLLTDNGRLKQEICHPSFKTEKTYHAQVEGKIIVINSWDRWCPICKKQTKLLNQAKKDFEDVLFLNSEVIKIPNFEYLFLPNKAQSNNSRSDEFGSSIAQI